MPGDDCPPRRHTPAACTMTPQVRRYVDVFGRERVHFVLLEDLALNRLEVYRGLLEFLGVDPDFVPPVMDVVNPNKELRVAGLQRTRQRLMPVETVVRRLVPRRLFAVVKAPLKVVWDANTRLAPRAPMPVGLEAELTDYFAPDVAALSQLIGRDLAAAWPRFRDVHSHGALASPASS